MIVVDASLAAKLVLDEPESPSVRSRWQRWADDSEIVLAPPMFLSETLSALRRAVYRGILDVASGEKGYEQLLRLDIETHEPPTLYRVAWDFAGRFNRPTIYDCCYLALASIVGCEFWTADTRLVNAVGQELAWVRHPA